MRGVGAGGGGKRLPEIARDVVQVLGRRCVDLLSGSPCQPLAAAEGGIELKGATLRQVWSGAQLEELLAAASAARATQALRPAPAAGQREMPRRRTALAGLF